MRAAQVPCRRVKTQTVPVVDCCNLPRLLRTQTWARTRTSLTRYMMMHGDELGLSQVMFVVRWVKGRYTSVGQMGALHKV